MSQLIELDYSDKTTIIIKVVVAIEAVVIIVEEKDTALQSSPSTFL